MYGMTAEGGWPSRKLSLQPDDRHWSAVKHLPALPRIGTGKAGVGCCQRVVGVDDLGVALGFLPGGLAFETQ